MVALWSSVFPRVCSTASFSVRLGILIGLLLVPGWFWSPEHAYAQNTVTQQLSLEQGENFVSLRVQPEDASLSTIFQGHLDQIHRVKDERGRVYMPGDGTEQFTTWDADESYKVYTTSAFDVEVTGMSFSLTTAAVPLEKGGNMIPFLPADPQAVDEALASVSGTLVRVESEEENAYEPGGAPSSLDSLRAGQGYALYVDQPDTLTYTIQTSTLMEALSLEGVQPGQYIRALGRDEQGDGGGGMFEVTSSGAACDGGTVFAFDEDLTQVTNEEVGNLASGPQSLSNTDVEFRGLTVRYGPDPEDEIELKHLIFQKHDEPAPWQLAADLAAGAIGGDGMFTFNNLHRDISNTYDKNKNEVSYQYATSDRRLERQGITNSVRPEWWGGKEGDPTVNNNPYLNLANLKARDIWENSNYDWVYVDLDGVYYYRETFPVPGGVELRGVGSLDHDSDMPVKYQDDYTQATLRVMPGEAMYHKDTQFLTDGGYDFEKDNRDRVHHGINQSRFTSIINAYNAEKVGLKRVKVDGNVRNNMQVFNNLSDYKNIEEWLQDSGDWSGFYTKSLFNMWWKPENPPVHVEDVHFVDLGASGLAIGKSTENTPDIQTSGEVEIHDTRRNHLLYGVTSKDNIDNLTIQGQYWGGNPLYDGRGVSQRTTYTNLTLKNINQGQFGYNTIIASRAGGLTIDGFTLDLKSSSKSGGQNPSILAVQDLGNKFKNGTIEGYLPENYGPGGRPTVLKQRSFAGQKEDSRTVLDGVTVIDNGVGMDLVQGTSPLARQVTIKNFEYKLGSGVSSGGGTIGRYDAPPKSGNPSPGDHAWRIFYENWDYKATTSYIFQFGAGDTRLDALPLDWYLVTGSVDNRHSFNRLANTSGGTSYEAIERSVRVFLNDFEFRTQTSANAEDGNSEDWHFDLAPHKPVRLRNCTDESGRVSENSGSYTSDASDEGNDFVLIDPNLISHPHQRSATVTSGNPSVTNVEGARPDGTPVDGTVKSNLDDAQKHVLRVNLDESIQADSTITVEWSAQVTPDEAYKSSGLFIARRVEDENGNPSLSFTSGNGPFTYDLRGVASSQESGERVLYTASSGDTSVVTAAVQSDDYTLELTEQGTGTAQITVTGEMSGVGTTTTTFEVTVE